MTVIFGLIYCNIAAVYTNSSSMLADIISSSLAAAVLSVPPVLLANKTDNSVYNTAADRSKVLGTAFSAIYLIYYLSALVYLIRVFAEFVSSRYLHGTSPLVCAVLSGIVCTYISWTGTEAVCRMSTVIAFLFALTSILFLFFAADDIVTTGLSASEIGLDNISKNGIFPYISAAIICLCSACKGSGKMTKKGVYFGISALLIISSAIVILISLVLGDYIYLSDYPSVDAVIYASRELSFRPDGLYFSFGTVILLAAAGFICSCCGGTLKCIIPNVKSEGLYTGAAVTIIASVEILFNINVCEYIFKQQLLIIALISVFPLIALLMSSSGKGKGKT